MADIARILAAFEQARVLVVGDTIVDLYTYGTALGLSAETPTIVARQQSVKRTLGGAAFVCRNLLELGARVDFLTLVGADDEAANVTQIKASKLDLIALRDPRRPTTVKHRFWVDNYKLFQLDIRDDAPVGDDIAADIVSTVRDRMANADAVLVSDYRHGMITPPVAAALVGEAKRAGKPIYVDSQVSQNKANHRDYGSGAIFCLNLKEARSIQADFAPSDDPASFAKLHQLLEADKLVVKLGEDGAMLFDGRDVHRVPARAVKVVDTTGAGDAFLASLVLTGTDSPIDALTISNTWAGLSIQIHGTIPPSKKDLASALAVAYAD